MTNGLHVDPSGKAPKPQAPKAIQALGQAREGFARVIAGGVILGILAIAYLVALFTKVEDADKILLVVGSGMGFLLGRGGRSGGDVG
jgi:hypothetical protein